MLETSPEPVRRLRVAGWAGILGGLAWGAVGALRQQSLAGPVFGLSHEVIGLATPAAAVLLLIGLQGVHRLHSTSRAGRVERRGYRLANAGLWLLAFIYVVDRWLLGEQVPPRGILVVSYLAAHVLVMVGLVIFGIGTVRAHVLPIWAKPLPILIGPAMVGALFTSIGAVDGLAWAALGVSVLITPLPPALAGLPASARPSPSLREVREAFLTRATLISGVLAVGVWSLEWSWIVGGETVTSEVARTLEQLGYERSAKVWRPAAAPTSDDELTFEAEAIRAGVLPGNANSVL
jgi:hypothetical protein